jgi:hypothetical protein
LKRPTNVSRHLKLLVDQFMRVSPELLTIVIPTRDRPELLETCLRSVFENQVSVPVIVSDNSIRSHSAIAALQTALWIRLRTPVRNADGDGAFQRVREACFVEVGLDAA